MVRPVVQPYHAVQCHSGVGFCHRADSTRERIVSKASVADCVGGFPNHPGRMRRFQALFIVSRWIMWFTLTLCGVDSYQGIETQQPEIAKSDFRLEPQEVRVNRLSAPIVGRNWLYCSAQRLSISRSVERLACVQPEGGCSWIAQEKAMRKLVVSEHSVLEGWPHQCGRPSGARSEAMSRVGAGAKPQYA